MPDQAWLNDAWSIMDALAAELRISVILGTERVDKDRPLNTARVTNSDGTLKYLTLASASHLWY